VQGLADASFCVADVSGNNPNVMWETGYAMALGKPTILIGQDIDALPFDLRLHRVLQYDTADLSALGDRLSKAIRDTLARYALKSTPDMPSQKPKTTSTSGRTVAVTGSMGANEASAIARTADVLGAYLSDSTTWYIGSVGVVDLAAAHYLLQNGQRVTVVGYDRFDCARELRALVQEGRLTFVDASTQSIPKGLQGPSARDVFFCMRSDLVILFWDGESFGTKQMVEYFQQQGICTLLASV
jgi:hypothetical protein